MKDQKTWLVHNMHSTTSVLYSVFSDVLNYSDKKKEVYISIIIIIIIGQENV